MIREMTLIDAIYVVQNMRASDRAALMAINPHMTDEQFAIDRFGTTFHYTITVGHTPVVIGGANTTPSGTAVAWMIATDRLPEVRKDVIRFCRGFVDTLFAEGTRRLEGYVLAGLPECERFAKFFGMTYEGCRRKAGAQGQDILIFGKVA